VSAGSWGAPSEASSAPPATVISASRSPKTSQNWTWGAGTGSTTRYPVAVTDSTRGASGAEDSTLGAAPDAGLPQRRNGARTTRSLGANVKPW